MGSQRVRHDWVTELNWTEDNIKHTNIHIIGVPEAEEKEKGVKNVSEEIMAENFPNVKKGTDIHVQEAQRVWNMMNPNITTPKILQLKCQKLKREF